jgi:hypothetical protein
MNVVWRLEVITLSDWDLNLWRVDMRKQLTLLALSGIASLTACVPAANSLANVPLNDIGHQSAIQGNGTRDAWRWPFSADSIWNRPLGSNAQLVPAGLSDTKAMILDVNYIFRVPAGAPERPVYLNPSWEVRCSGQKPQYNPNGRTTVPIPDDWVIPSGNSNNASAFLLSDGRTLVQINPLARCTRGGPVYGGITQDVDLFGPGVEGGHGGSGMSSIGGTIRLGELTSPNPIQHALKVTLWSKKYMAINNDGTPGFRWPALNADGYLRDPIMGYAGRNPALEMGALLAIGPNETAEKLGIKTAVGRKLFQALKDYGAYVVDDSACDCFNLTAEQGVNEEVKRVFGHSLQASGGQFFNDVNRMLNYMFIVNNNAPGSVGGGGTPRRPLALPFARRR